MMPDRLRQMILTSGTTQIEACMRLETLPTLKTWSWYAGALHQYQTAFLLLAELYTYPDRREADRIWKVLDYVFEVPPELPRDGKARIILTEIRDKMNAYGTARKLKPPTSMSRRIGEAAPRSEQDLAQNDPLGLPSAPLELSMDTEIRPTIGNAQIPVPPHDGHTSAEGGLYFPAPGGELRAVTVPVTVPMTNAGEPALSSGGSSNIGAHNSGSATSIVDEMMADIDWVTILHVFF